MKRPGGILRYNIEVMRDNGAPAEVIAQYLSDNDTTIEQVVGFPKPNENELGRMLESEKSGDWAKSQSEFESRMAEFNKRQASREKTMNTLETAQGLARGFGQGLLYGFGDELESALTGQPVEQIRQEQRVFQKENPILGIGSAVAGAVSNPLSYASVAPAGAGLGTKIGLGALQGAAEGALYGFGSGEGTSDRLANSGWGALTGGVVGGLAPAVIESLGAAGNTIKRIVQGYKKSLPEEKISDFILKQAVQPGKDSALKAKVLSEAALNADSDILNAATNLNSKISAMDKLRVPQLVEVAQDVPWSSATPSAQKILDSVETPALKAAKNAYKAFDAATPTNVKGAGLAFDKLAKEEPALWRLISRELRENAPDWVDTPFTSRAGLKRMSEVLTSDLPKSNLTGVKYRSVERSIKKLDDLTEALYPGSKAIDQKYAVAKSVQDYADDVVRNRIKQIAQLPFNKNFEVSLTGASKLALHPWVRGRAREMILNDGNLYQGVSNLITDPARAGTSGLWRELYELGRAKGEQ